MRIKPHPGYAGTEKPGVDPGGENKVIESVHAAGSDSARRTALDFRCSIISYARSLLPGLFRD